MDKFDGDLTKFADWSDRMRGKIHKAHCGFQGVLEWIEKSSNGTPISEMVEQGFEQKWLHTGINFRQASADLYDVLVDRTTSALLDKRKLARGRGFEYWRILVHDFGTASVDAQSVRLQNFMDPTKAASIPELVVALDRWKTLGAELGRPVEDDFKLIALKKLVPAKLTELMNTQESL